MDPHNLGIFEWLEHYRYMLYDMVCLAINTGLYQYLNQDCYVLERSGGRRRIEISISARYILNSTTL